MHALSTHELLSVWERGARLTALHRGQLLLTAAAPDATPEELGCLSVGQRDDLLLAIRAAAFGEQIEATAACPCCSEALEMAFDINQLRSGGDCNSIEPLILEFEGHVLTFRLPHTFDLIELSSQPDLEHAETELLRRCLLSARSGKRELTVEQLPASVVQAISDRLSEVDPLADIHLSLACPACDHRWQEPFDIVTFFWREIESWAMRLLRDVHLLAATYGWSEADIVALSPSRRQIYIELAAA